MSSYSLTIVNRFTDLTSCNKYSVIPLNNVVSHTEKKTVEESIM